MRYFFRLTAAGPAFFLSAWLLMIFAGIVASDVGVRPFGYLTSMVVTIALWLVLAPAIGAVARGPRRESGPSTTVVHTRVTGWGTGRGRDISGAA